MAVLKSGSKFFKKAAKGSRNFKTVQLEGSSTKFSYETPGRVPGSKAVYEKVVDTSGKTTQVTKTTYGPDGKIIHIKDKLIK